MFTYVAFAGLSKFWKLRLIKLTLEVELQKNENSLEYASFSFLLQTKWIFN